MLVHHAPFPVLSWVGRGWQGSVLRHHLVQSSLRTFPCPSESRLICLTASLTFLLNYSTATAMGTSAITYPEMNSWGFPSLHPNLFIPVFPRLANGDSVLLIVQPTILTLSLTPFFPSYPTSKSPPDYHSNILGLFPGSYSFSLPPLVQPTFTSRLDQTGLTAPVLALRGCPQPGSQSEPFKKVKSGQSAAQSALVASRLGEAANRSLRPPALAQFPP